MNIVAFADLPFGNSVTFSHWNLVVGIGLAFLVVQLAITFRLYWKIRRQAVLLARLCRDYERGGTGRRKLRAISKHFSWLSWVLAVFPAKAKVPNGNFSREDVLEELDARIASNLDYLLLQRLGVMAPLLGVILTVLGFFWLDVDTSDDQSLRGILSSVTPLVIGVGIGAALALVNQSLLYLVGCRIESLRMTARMWFDTVIWSHVGVDSQAATAESIAAVECFSQALAASADRYENTSGRIELSSTSMQTAASRLHDALELFSAELDGIPTALGDIRIATAAGAEALDQLIPIGTRAVSNLDVSVAAFRTTIDREFAQAAKRHEVSSATLADSVAQIHETTNLLKAGSDELKQASQSNSAAFRAVDELLGQRLTPGIVQFVESLQVLTGQVENWSQMADSMSKSAESLNGQVSKLSEGLLPTITSACDAADQRLGATLSEQATHVESISHSASELRESAQQVAEMTTATNGELREVTVALKDMIDAEKHQALASGDIDRLTLAISRVAESADALALLSEQIRDALEQNGGHDVGLSKASGGLRSWLSSRPR